MKKGLIHQGYHYYRHKESRNKTLWRCEDYKKGCKGWAVEQNGFINVTRGHNHPADTVLIDFYKNLANRIFEGKTFNLNNFLII